MTSSYSEMAPRQELRPWVRLLWRYRDDAPSRAVQRIPSDGCPELIVHLGEPYEELEPDGGFVRQPRVIGQLEVVDHLRGRIGRLQGAATQARQGHAAHGHRQRCRQNPPHAVLPRSWRFDTSGFVREYCSRGLAAHKTYRLFVSALSAGG